MAEIQIQIIFKGHPPLWTVSKKETDCLPYGFLNKIYLCKAIFNPFYFYITVLIP